MISARIGATRSSNTSSRNKAATGSASDDNDADTEPTDADSSDAEASGEDGENGEEGEDGDEEEESRVPVSVAEAGIGSVSAYVSATANLIAEAEVTVVAEAEGRLQELHVEEGDRVEKGQLLAALVRDDEQIFFDKAQVKAQNAKLAFDRTTRLASEGLVAEEELETATMEHRVSEQELAEAQWQLEKTEIRAPFSGQITARHITVGQHLQLGDELFVVTNFDPLIARIYLPEKDVLTLSLDRPVRITLQADDDVRFMGRIRQISPVVDVATGTVKITLEAVRPPAGVRPGGFVDIDITRETRSGVVLLPREAIIRELQRAHVFVAEDDLAVKREVTLGLEEGDFIEVVSGLEGGASVVVAGQGGLKDGMAIKVIPDPTEVAAVGPDSDEPADSEDS